jgi:hypothetical protein
VSSSASPSSSFWSQSFETFFFIADVPGKGARAFAPGKGAIAFAPGKPFSACSQSQKTVWE